MSTPRSLQKNLIIQLFLGVICLFLPFVFMKIGPKGYAFYGPTVPDIYILGGYIFGKDVAFSGINFAYKFQLAIMLACIGIALFCYHNHSKIKSVFLLQVIIAIVLLLFPFWMYLYTGGVWCNSDGADLTIYPHVGWIAYVLLVYFQIRIFKGINQMKLQK